MAIQELHPEHCYLPRTSSSLLTWCALGECRGECRGRSEKPENGMVFDNLRVVASKILTKRPGARIGQLHIGSPGADGLMELAFIELFHGRVSTKLG